MANNQNRKILVTGSRGFIGKNLYNSLSQNGFEVYGISRSESPSTDYPLDISDREGIHQVLERTQPEIVIHCAALSNVEFCETNPLEVEKNNVLATQNICDSLDALKNPAKLIYISTDYVYDGINGNFDEDSKTNPLNFYGLSKLKAEGLVSKLQDSTILRTTVAFGYDPGGKNFFMQLLSSQKSKIPMKIPLDQISNPTYIDTISESVFQVIKQDISGLFLLTGPESISRYNFALKIADIIEFDKKLMIPVRTDELNQKAKRPLNCSSSSLKLQRALNYNFPLLSESIRALKDIVLA